MLVDQARRTKQWHKTAEAWCAAAFTSRATLNRFWGGKAIRSEIFRAICEAVNVDWQMVAVQSQSIQTENPFPAATQDGGESCPPSSVTVAPAPPLLPVYTWGDAPDTAGFVGRGAELQILTRWLQDRDCRMVVLLGMGGIGKTALSVRGAQLHHQNVDALIWCSLRNAPPVDIVIRDCIAQLLPQAVPQLPSHLDGLINELLRALKTCRCLLMLDNLESILQEGSRTGNYRQGFEGYGQLLRSLSDTRHPSQVIITAREMPRGLSAREGRDLPVRCLKLTGLPTDDSQALFHYKGSFAGSESDWQQLTTRYGGNPLALKIVASAIRDFFNGDLGQFLQVIQQESFILDDIRDLIARQFERLPALEQSLMYWLAINREPITLQTLQDDLFDPPPMGDLLQALASLQQRSLIEKQDNTFTQQPVVMEYVTARLIDDSCTELLAEPCLLREPRSLLATHALSKATSQDYLRQSQMNLILQPILQRLVSELPAPHQVQQAVQAYLAHLRQNTPAPSYAPGNLLTLLQQLNADITGYDFSGLAIWQANLQDFPLHQVNFAGCHFSRTLFTENLGNILAAVFSPVVDDNKTGHTLATCDTDCTIRLWAATSGKLLKIFQGHTNWVRAVAFSPCGQVLASGAADHTMRLWDVDSGACLGICQGHSNEVFTVAFSADGQWIASGSSDQTIRLWHKQSGDCRQVLQGHRGCVRTVAFCPGSITLASGSDDGTIRLWDVQTGQCLKVLMAHSGGVRSVAMAAGEAADDLYLASGGIDNFSDSDVEFHALLLWNAYTGAKFQTCIGHEASIYAVAVAPQPSFQVSPVVASGSGDCTIRLWHSQTGQCLKILTGHSNQVSSLSFDPAGETLVAVSLDQTMRLWHVATAQPIRTWSSHTDWVYPVAFSPDSRWLVSGSNNGSVQVWDVAQRICQHTLVGHQDQICSVAVCPDQRLIASASRDQTIRIWDMATGQCQCLLRGHTDWVYTVAFAPNLKAPSGSPLLASGGADATIRLWDCHTAECLQTCMGHQGQVWDVAFSQGGLLASAGSDHTARVWDAATGNCLQILKGHKNRVYSVAFKPVAEAPRESEEILLTSSSDRTLKTWRWPTGDCLRTHYQHSNWVFSAAYSPDGDRFASGSHDHTVGIWDTNTGDFLYSCKGHDHLVSSVAYSPDGQIIASGSQDQSVRLWNSYTGDEIGILQTPRLYEGLNLVGATGLTKAQQQTLIALGAVVSLNQI